MPLPKPPKGSKKGLKCETPWCRRTKAKNGAGRYQKVCNKCKSRQLKARHPETYVLNIIRQRARRKKIPFSLTLEQFREFCARTGYIEQRGNKPSSLTVARINHDEGYHSWNIDVCNHLDNSTAGHTVPGKVTKQNTPMPKATNESVPF